MSTIVRWLDLKNTYTRLGMDVIIDFIVGLPQTLGKFDSAWVNIGSLI